MLDDDVLLQIFEFYANEDKEIEGWITLVHVCRLWRSLVFQSPRHLNLRLDCTPKKQMRDMDIWPPLPLIVRDFFDIFPDASSVDNTIAALEYNDRVSQIELESFPLEYVANSEAMQKPFPELTHLKLGTTNNDGPILRDSFLGGSAPRLRTLNLINVPFPGLPKLLLSATQLVNLELYDIPHFGSGYVPPEEIATCLSALTGLEYLCLYFRYVRPVLEIRRPPAPQLTRSIIPSLTKIQFQGKSEYLEQILARIDAPRINELCITFFNQFIFDTPQLFQFISQKPTLSAPEKGHITFSSNLIMIKLLSQTLDYGVLVVDIPCSASELRRLSSFKLVYTSSLPYLSALEDLYIHEDSFLDPFWQDNVESTSWLQLLRPFAAVKNLYLDKEFAPRFAPALQELVGGRTAEVLPTLENIFLEGFQASRSLHNGIETFVSARRLTNRPVVVSCWVKDSE